MKQSLLFLIALMTLATATAQKTRPDAFPPVADILEPKAIIMAETLEQMYSWNRYPTYGVYLEMMQHFAEQYPTLCHLDTIGTSLEGRLILSLAITGAAINDTSCPEVFYSATIHGDEIAGYYMMLRLCDTLLESYGTSPDLTDLLNTTHIYINPLSNPDGTYHGGDNTVANAWRYNSNEVDLNRNYPDPFGTDPLDPVQQENLAMIDYVNQHHFLLSANIHGGSEVMNYPWDSFTSYERPHDYADWWTAVCKRFVDSCQLYDNELFTDVVRNGYLQGGDWYVIHNGRQDYFNYYNNLREVTIELSVSKKLNCSWLNHYWNAMGKSLINYIKEVHHLDGDDDPESICHEETVHFNVYPNPTHGKVVVEGANGNHCYDLTNRPAGVYILNVEGHAVKVVKR